MQILNLPPYDFRFRRENNKQYVYDIFRRKYVVLTPEEWVRQCFAMYLIEEKGYPASLIMTEYSLQLNKSIRRCDILVHKPAGKPAVLVECKAPGVSVSGETFDQASRYNLVFKVKYLIVTNGMKHYCCMIDFDSRKIEFLDEIPSYSEIG